MRVQTVICDKCGQEIKGHPIQIVPIYTDVATGDIHPDEAGFAPHEEEQGHKDYCESCCSKIIAYANGLAVNPDFEKAVADAEQEADKKVLKKNQDKKAPAGKKKIDTGKLLALKKAGWEPSAIAEELGITVRAVYDYTHRLKKEMEKAKNE